MTGGALVLVTAGIALTIMPHCQGQATEWRRGNDAVRTGAVSLNPPPANKREVLDLARRVTPDNCPAWTVIYLGARKDTGLALDPGPIEYAPLFEKWVAGAWKSLTAAGAIGKLVCHRDNQVLTFRNDGEHVEHEVLKGSDVTRIGGAGKGRLCGDEPEPRLHAGCRRVVGRGFGWRCEDIDVNSAGTHVLKSDGLYQVTLGWFDG